MSTYRLCYVCGPWAYFTTQALDKQWGDDWDDAPYEHNAGSPYEWHPRRGGARYSILRVAFDGWFSHPCDGHLNSPYSVQNINLGAAPWLRSDDHPDKELSAGATFGEFVDFVLGNRGSIALGVVRVPAEDGEPA